MKRQDYPVNLKAFGLGLLLTLTAAAVVRMMEAPLEHQLAPLVMGAGVSGLWAIQLPADQTGTASSAGAATEADAED